MSSGRRRSGVLSLLSIALWFLMSSAAPLPEFSGDLGFQQFVQNSQEFSGQMMNDAATMKALIRTELNLGNDNALLLLKESLGIPQVDLPHCRSEPCDVQSCLNQMREGFHIYHSYLSLVEQSLPKFAGRVSHLQKDISDLSFNIQQQMEESGLAIVTYPTNQAQPTFVQTQGQIGSYIVLSNFHKFLETTLRALRHCSS